MHDGSRTLARARLPRRSALLVLPLAAGTLLLTACEPDTDGDTYTDAQESAIGWDPNSADQDANGILDNAQDLDGDGVLWFHEASAFSSDDDPDSDDDGLGDGHEIANGSDPTIFDDVDLVVSVSPGSGDFYPGVSTFTATATWPDPGADISYEWTIEDRTNGFTPEIAGGPHDENEAGWNLAENTTYVVSVTVSVDDSVVSSTVDTDIAVGSGAT